MIEIQSKPLNETEEKIVEAAIRCFVRFGARKTAMADIAAEAGVSRQTLYDLFGGKDDLIRASIRVITDRNLAAVRGRLDACKTLSEKLDAYFAETVIKSFELLQNAGDAEDLVSGHNEAGRDEITRSRQRHEILICELLAPYEAALAANGLTVKKQAHLFVTTVMALKYGASSRDDLDQLLSALLSNVLAVASTQQ
ncbi:TetR/AcrR family transcriptional regulator [Roseibium sp.]|uniref:TetR/AcrR family transcriptional regulator n=1 Tax=Roseibium sp. TaxID=1936156 RepID=UPI003BAB5165